MQGKTVSFRELRAAEFPPQNYLISHGLLPVNGLLVVGGASKSLKSFTLNALIFGLTTGQQVFGNIPDGMFSVPSPKRVLYLEQEIGEEDCQHRMLPAWSTMTEQEQELMDSNLFIHSQDYDLLLDTDKGCETIEKAIEECKPEVLCFDPLKNFMAQSDENSTREMGLVINNIFKMKIKHNLAVIIAHHTAKPSASGEQREGPHSLRGSSVLYGAGDAFLIQRLLSRRHGRVRMDFTVRRHKPLDSINAQLDPDTLMMRYMNTIRDDDEPQKEAKPNGVGSLVR